MFVATPSFYVIGTRTAFSDEAFSTSLVAFLPAPDYLLWPLSRLGSR